MPVRVCMDTDSPLYKRCSSQWDNWIYVIAKAWWHLHENVFTVTCIVSHFISCERVLGFSQLLLSLFTLSTKFFLHSHTSFITFIWFHWVRTYICGLLWEIYCRAIMLHPAEHGGKSQKPLSHKIWFCVIDNTISNWTIKSTIAGFRFT